MRVWDGVKRCERRCMESEAHQVHEEVNHLWFASGFPHSPSSPPLDNNIRKNVNSQCCNTDLDIA